METNLLDRMLNTYLAEQTAVTVTLQNKIRVSGKIKAFDSYVIVLEGPKREILYRHAVSCLAPQPPAEHKQPVSRQEPAKTVVKPVKASAQKPRQRQPQAMLSVSTGDSGINSSMKDGLLKWMQVQKAAK